MSSFPFTPTLAPHALHTGGGRRKPLAQHARGEGAARVSGRVRGRIWRFAIAGLTLPALILLLALGGCGKKSAPQTPPDVPNTYPRPYPSE
jgi:hypothetical protein